ncbi:short-chain dehydrogenase [Colletotrichum tofieldiae]|nr:short-chain dehydrogenase [Colletotrichum tofieldiae]
MSTKKIILVTGANQGIGYDTSVALASASPENHVIVGARSQERGAKAVEDLRARNPAGTVSLLQLDITSNDSIKAAVENITAEFGVLDVLVNNAGMIVMQPKDRRSELLETFNTNVASTLILTEALIPLLQKSKDPRIINVSSAYDPGSPFYEVRGEAYRISKAALNMATAHMAFDYKSWNAKRCDSSETSAQGILEIVEGKRDSEAGKFVARFGKQYNW